MYVNIKSVHSVSVCMFEKLLANNNFCMFNFALTYFIRIRILLKFALVDIDSINHCRGLMRPEVKPQGSCVSSECVLVRVFGQVFREACGRAPHFLLSAYLC